MPDTRTSIQFRFWPNRVLGPGTRRRASLPGISPLQQAERAASTVREEMEARRTESSPAREAKKKGFKRKYMSFKLAKGKYTQAVAA